MKKKINTIGATALGTFLLSVVFKLMHWMGAPTLLLISTVLGISYLLTLLFHAFQNR